jgi:2-hydroxymuconate-semialdehyde hydrolase
MKSCYVNVDGCNTHYLAAGDGPPLVLVHGGNMDNAAMS